MTDPLSIVMSRPPEEWSDAYIVMHDCLRTFKPERGSLKGYFFQSLRNCQYHQRGRNMVRERVLQKLRDKTPRIGEATQYTGPDMPENVPEVLIMQARGMSYKQIGYALGISSTTIGRRLLNYKSSQGAPCEPCEKGTSRKHCSRPQSTCSTTRTIRANPKPSRSGRASTALSTQ